MQSWLYVFEFYMSEKLWAVSLMMLFVGLYSGISASKRFTSAALCILVLTSVGISMVVVTERFNRQPWTTYFLTILIAEIVLYWCANTVGEALRFLYLWFSRKRS